MLDGLKPLSQEELCIAAPEGLSRFYIRGTDGRVGASWMTRDERLSDIEDHISYLNHWWSSLGVPSDAEIVVLGFSQGVATAARWLADGSLSMTCIYTIQRLHQFSWNLLECPHIERALLLHQHL